LASTIEATGNAQQNFRLGVTKVLGVLQKSLFTIGVYYFTAYFMYVQVLLLKAVTTTFFILCERLYGLSRFNYNCMAYFARVSPYTGQSLADQDVFQGAEVSNWIKAFYALSPFILYYGCKLVYEIYRFLKKYFYGDESDDSDDSDDENGRPGGRRPPQQPPQVPSNVSGESSEDSINIIVSNNVNQLRSPEEVKVDDLPEEPTGITQASINNLDEYLLNIFSKYKNVAAYTWVPLSEFLSHFSDNYHSFGLSLMKTFKNTICSPAFRTEVLAKDNGEGLLELLDQTLISESYMTLIDQMVNTTLHLPMHKIYVIVKIALSLYGM
jgi:hypothetical protein